MMIHRRYTEPGPSFAPPTQRHWVRAFTSRTPTCFRQPLHGFTLVELLIVMAVIVLLVAILLPVINKVKKQGQVTATRAQIIAIEQACTSYHFDYNAYPGVYLEAALAGSNLKDKISGTENLVLSLMGGHAGDAGQHTKNLSELEDRGLLQGPEESIGSNNRKAAYYTPKNNELRRALRELEVDASGSVLPALTTAGDEAYVDHIPEFHDRFSEGLPLIYLRARPGRKNIIGETSNEVANAIFNATAAYAYARAITPNGEASNLTWAANIAKLITDPRYTDEELYDPDMTDNDEVDNFDDSHRWKTYHDDRFVLISAGPDRIYGTKDDVCNFDLQPQNYNAMAAP